MAAVAATHLGLYGGPRRPWPAWQAWLIGIALTLFIGLRHEVGGDWFSYIPYLTRAEGIPLAEAIAMGDPGYNTLNWLFAGNALGIYGVNMVSGHLFSWLSFVLQGSTLPAGALLCRSLHGDWWWLWATAVRGLPWDSSCPACLPWREADCGTFCWLGAAASFHSTALVMLLFVFPAVRGRTIVMRLLRLMILLIVGAALVQTFLIAHVEMLVAGYIEVEYQSQGAAIRVAMNLLPGLMLLLWPKRFDFTEQQLRLWRAIAITAFGCALA